MGSRDFFLENGENFVIGLLTTLEKQDRKIISKIIQLNQSRELFFL